MSEIPAGRPLRSDAERRRTVILDAAAEVLGGRPEASMEDVALAAGVSRQTVYAHFPTRDRLLGAVLQRITDEAALALDAAALDEGPADAALGRFLDATWRTFERHPLLLHPSVATADVGGDEARHEDVASRLERLIRRGQRSGVFDRGLAPAWLVRATVALGHLAGAEVGTGAMGAKQAARTLRRSVFALYGVPR